MNKILWSDINFLIMITNIILACSYNMVHQNCMQCMTIYINTSQDGMSLVIPVLEYVNEN